MNRKSELRSALQLCKSSLIAVAVFSGVANLLMLVPAFFMLNVYDKAVGHNSLDTLWALCAIAAFLFGVLGAMEAYRSRVLVAISSRLDQVLAPTFFDLSFRNAVLAGSDKATIQPLVDLNNLRQFVTGTGVFALFDAPWLPIYLAVLFLFHPLLGWLGVFAALLLLAIAILNQIKTTQPLSEANDVASKQTLETQRNLRNAEVTAAMGMMPALRGKWRERQDEMLLAQETASHSAGLFNATTKTLRLAVQSAAIAAGAFLVLQQEISPGMLIAGSILIGRALQPVEIAVGAWRGFVDSREQYLRLVDWLANSRPDTEKMALPVIAGNVSVKNVAMAAPGSRKPALSGITFDIPAGATCMIFGSSGAGKSTLLRGILGLWPTQAGEIRIDGTEAFKYERSELGPQLGYLPQDIELLEGSVSQNISRFGNVDPDLVIQAAEDAGIHEFILALPNGYDTELGQVGGVLSPGQRQRVALARALYARPSLVILDEPNSNLDEAGEVALGRAIQILKENGSTVLIVSHRQNILPLTDYLLVLAGGQIVDFGGSDDVLHRLNSKFKDGAGGGDLKNTRSTKTIAKTVPVVQPLPSAGT